MDPYLRPDRRERARQRDKREPPGRNHPLLTALRVLVILLFGILIVQLVRLQVINSDEYARRAEINALREVQIPATRGLILDQDGRPLVLNAARYSPAILPGSLPARGERGLDRHVGRRTGRA